MIKSKKSASGLRARPFRFVSLAPTCHHHMKKTLELGSEVPSSEEGHLFLVLASELQLYAPTTRPFF